jgi:hypothetical protein
VGVVERKDGEGGEDGGRAMVDAGGGATASQDGGLLQTVVAVAQCRG